MVGAVEYFTSFESEISVSLRPWCGRPLPVVNTCYLSFVAF